MTDLRRRGGNLDPKSACLWWISSYAGDKIRKNNRAPHKLPFEKRFKILGQFQSSQKDEEQLGGKDAECEQGMVERCEATSKDVPWRV